MTRPAILVARPVFPEILALLREHFEVDRRFVVLATLRALAEAGEFPSARLTEVIAKLGADGSEVRYTTPAEFTRMVEDEIRLVRNINKTLKLTLE